MKRLQTREEVCMNCRLCQVFCLVAHSRSKDVIKAYKKEVPRPVARLQVEQKGPFSLAVPCRHCDEPLCVYSCLTGALQKDPETGVVSLDRERCVGCWTCLLVCPYGAITQDTAQGVVAKCDLCPGQATPACVANCPNEALFLAEVNHA